MLKNKSNIYVVQVPSMATVKIVPSNDNVHVLLNLDGDVCLFLVFIFYFLIFLIQDIFRIEL